jgi:ABC-type thiamine transport system substrate-binding protein
VNPQVILDEAFVRHLVQPQKTASISAEQIAAKRESWIKAWTETVLR